MINGIKPIVSKSTPTEKTATTNGLSFDNAMDTLLVKIQEDYNNWRGVSHRTMDIKLKPGRKFIKIIIDTSVWGFISLVDGMHKEAPIKVGDIMKAASWASVAKHSRGSIFDKEMHKSFSWTGPNYL
jgi:hypothetical protein